MSAAVVFLKDHEVEHPATELHSSTLREGGFVKVCDIPASVTRYAAGSVVKFSRKADAKAFVEAMGGAARLEG